MAREMITLNLCLRIAAEDFYRVRKLLEFRKRRERVRIFERRLQVQIEAITPRRARDGAALDFEQVQVTASKGIQYPAQ